MHWLYSTVFFLIGFVSSFWVNYHYPLFGFLTNGGVRYVESRLKRVWKILSAWIRCKTPEIETELVHNSRGKNINFNIDPQQIQNMMQMVQGMMGGLKSTTLNTPQPPPTLHSAFIPPPPVPQSVPVVTPPTQKIRQRKIMKTPSVQYLPTHEETCVE